jgi:hypothetical protein
MGGFDILAHLLKKEPLMKKTSFLFLSLIPALVACNSIVEIDYRKPFVREGQKTDVAEEMVIKAQIEATDTKTSLDGVSVLWTTGDQVKIFNASNPSGVVYTLSEGAGTTQATFSGSALSGDGPFYAVYPASSATGLSGESVSVVLPQTQILTKNSFGNGANLAIAKVDGVTDVFSFKNALGAVSFSLNADPSMKGVRIQTRGTEALSGSGTLTLGTDTPALTMDPVTSLESQVVSLEGSAQTGPFYMMLPPGALTGGFLVEFRNADDMAMVKSAKSTPDNEIKRNEILAMPSFDFTEQIKGAFLDQTSFGYFGNIGTSGLLDAFAFDKVTCQYAVNTDVGTSRYVRLQSLPLGKYYAIGTPYVLDLGTTYDDVSVESVVGATYTAPATSTYRVIRKSDNAAWMVSSDMQKGIILLLED